MAQPEGTKRYRANQLPHFVKGSLPNKTSRPDLPKKKSVERVNPKKLDKRLARLQAKKQNEKDDEERLQRHRRIIHEAEVIEEQEEIIEPKPSETIPVPQKEDRLEQKNHAPDSPQWNPEREEERAKIREKLKEEVDEAAVDELPFGDEDAEKKESEEDSDFSTYEEYSSSEGEDFFQNRPAFEPVFVPKDKRQTLNERERLELESKKIEEQKEKRNKEKRADTLNILKEEIKEDLQKENAVGDDEIEVPDEEENVEREYELWKIRELKRIKREREQRDKWQKEKEEIERRRKMTDQEVMLENRKDPEKVKTRKKMKFLQRYYHSGAFFLDDLQQLKKSHDFAEPVGEDKFTDRSTLPKVMQVKNFGRAGRTKYTHLVAEDTTFVSENPWNTPNETRLNYITKMGGLKDQTFDRPTKKRKKNML
eukprot:TRINITY_DN8122_c0_g1_i1.p1 TRINITY_DN8122_c0_g1~~TRINITY_DN8122_c0_g1_i1.p1  ORF type:complete len:424 (+),score=149.92 TRINITY_DN8122_c0_g1_i1:62-1333(+)